VDICLTALLNPGDNLLTPCPDYPLYSAVLAKLEIGLNTYYLNEEDGWQPDLDDIKKKITPRTRGIVLINPNNPTGSVCSRKMLEQIAELARQHNLIVFADEITTNSSSTEVQKMTRMSPWPRSRPTCPSLPSADSPRITSPPDGASDGRCQRRSLRHQTVSRRRK